MKEPPDKESLPTPPEPETDPGGEREQRVSRALADFLDRQAREDPMDIESFCHLHPHLEPDLRSALETLRQIDELAELGEPAGEPGGPEELPERLSGHKILGEIGAGGMGRVLLAVDERLGRSVAIKTLNSRYRHNAQIRSRFMQEARAMARLSHPHIVRIYNLGQPDEEPHFVMEYVEGASLTEAARALTLRQKVELLRKIVLAVDFLHQHQIVHRDLKPGNIRVGPDLEPKLLDFGLARQVDESDRKLTRPGEVMGTPDYFSPEQTRGETDIDARSDIFSLGTVLYELLTATVPFRGESYAELACNIREQDPILPRRLDPDIPGDLQNICLKALEKNPAQRYASAREMADDLERHLAGEPVLAVPSSYARLTEGKIEQHLRELQGWKQDHILSDYEYDALRKAYDRLVEREDAWILQVRRLSPSQVTLYLGGWILVIGAALLFLFFYPQLQGTASVLLVSAVAGLTGAVGIRLWNEGQLRIAVAYLLAFCLLLPIALVEAGSEYGFFTALTQGDKDLEFFYAFESFKKITNAQLWWSLLLSLPAYVWLRRFTRSSVFSLVFAVMGTLLFYVSLFRLGFLKWLGEDTDKFYYRLLGFAGIYFLTGIFLERNHKEFDSRYFYPVAVVHTFWACSGLATFKHWTEWLEATFPWTRGQAEYFFILNAAVYFLLHLICESLHTGQMRAVAKTFRFVIPGHVMTSLLLLGLEATKLWQESPEVRALHIEARTFEFLLPVVACLFVFGSIPKQMKNYLVTGLFFLAVGLIRLEQNFFKDQAGWPMFLLVAGVLLMLAAANYTTLRITLARWSRRKP